MTHDTHVVTDQFSHFIFLTNERRLYENFKLQKNHKHTTRVAEGFISLDFLPCVLLLYCGGVRCFGLWFWNNGALTG